MNDLEFRRRLYLHLIMPRAFIEATARATARGDTHQTIKGLWRVVDVICAAEPKPAEAPVGLCRKCGSKVPSSTLAGGAIISVRLCSDCLAAEPPSAEPKQAEAHDTELAHVKYMARITALESREADARACAEWIERWANSGGPGWNDALAVARRYLSGEPAPKADETIAPSIFPHAYRCCACDKTSNDVRYLCKSCHHRNVAPKPPIEAMERLRECLQASVNERHTIPPRIKAIVEAAMNALADHDQATAATTGDEK